MKTLLPICVLYVFTWLHQDIEFCINQSIIQNTLGEHFHHWIPSYARSDGITAGWAWPAGYNLVLILQKLGTHVGRVVNVACSWSLSCFESFLRFPFLRKINLSLIHLIAIDNRRTVLTWAADSEDFLQQLPAGIDVK